MVVLLFQILERCVLQILIDFLQSAFSFCHYCLNFGTLPANGQCEYFCVCLNTLCRQATGLIFLSESCVYTETRLLLSGSQISWAEFTDKTTLSYKQCYMKRFHKSCMTFQSLLPCHFSGWHFWWDGKTLTCTVWLKGLASSLIQNISLSLHSPLWMNLKLKRN